MILYSIVPMEAVMGQKPEKQEIFQLDTLDVGGVKMLVERSGTTSEAKIVRLLSTDPQHFLNPQYTPGKVIRS